MVRKLLTLIFMLLICYPAAAQETTPESPLVFRLEDFTVDFGDFVTDAQITYPAEGNEPFPTVILIHGSTPADMDFSVMGFDGTIVSTIFKDIAEYLPTRGVAVIRYNKHYVSGFNQVDTENYATITLPQLVADAGKVLDSALENPLVDAERIFIYGWSEGSVVGSQLAVERVDDVAGLILQGAVGLSFRETFAAQITDVTVPYLRTFAADGLVNIPVIQQALFGDGGLVAKGNLFYFVDQAQAQLGQFIVNPEIDTNGDETISLDDEFLPAVDSLLDAAFAPEGFFSIYAETGIPIPTAQADKLLFPVLILQGENDANTTARGAQVLYDALTEAGNADVTLNLYPGLGHSLGAAETIIDDSFRPIDPQPMADTADWVLSHSS